MWKTIVIATGRWFSARNTQVKKISFSDITFNTKPTYLSTVLQIHRIQKLQFVATRFTHLQTIWPCVGCYNASTTQLHGDIYCTVHSFSYYQLLHALLWLRVIRLRHAASCLHHDQVFQRYQFLLHLESCCVPGWVSRSLGGRRPWLECIANSASSAGISLTPTGVVLAE
jgi:hypothetical protein